MEIETASGGANRGSGASFEFKARLMGTPVEFATMLNFLNDRGIRPTIDSVLPLDHVTEAMRHLDSFDQCGKIVLRVTQDP